ncbi:uncharacterized protein LOC119317603 [Triticum dicoccoides]|uniref:uncharacterized protein LOC119317603 n=1 Tax=Triticum dicoccoides TaxID=85692 RepID=UPI001890CE6E|nr:uncharacterized protein LOC119317603 [Triticum dicoccoides]
MLRYHLVKEDVHHPRCSTSPSSLACQDQTSQPNCRDAGYSGWSVAAASWQRMVARYLVPRSTAPPFPSGLIDGSKEISGDSRLSSLSTTYVVFVVDVATSLSCENRRSTLNITSSLEEQMLFITASLHMLTSPIFMKALYKALAPYLLGMDRRRCRGSASWPR